MGRKEEGLEYEYDLYVATSVCPWLLPVYSPKKSFKI